MKLATLETTNGLTIAGVDLTGDSPRYIDLRAIDDTLPRSLKALLASEDGIAHAANAMRDGLEKNQYVEGKLHSPIASPGKVICIGLNYRDHAEESGMAIPSEPVCFSKFSSAVIGPEANVELPKASSQVDYEAELVAVIGRQGKNIAAADAKAYVAGYMNGNDVSARDWQIGRPGGQWLLGKTPDTFAPTGPWMVTADEIADPEQLGISLRLNGETMQSSTTKELIFGIDELIAHLSKLITLEPGDLIFTGTPPGVGMARKPPVFLKPGDSMEVEIEGLGVLKNPVIAAE
jgi:2-keto-4-pentenoate hydratase/2-oxohepta-3-ene-1,7-dioic acid hydratase in catechol pathway